MSFNSGIQSNACTLEFLNFSTLVNPLLFDPKRIRKGKSNLISAYKKKLYCMAIQYIIYCSYLVCLL